jgi:uncharacterized protein (TIGR03435 family)
MAYAVKDCQIFGPGVEGGCEIRRRGQNACRGIAQPGPGDAAHAVGAAVPFETASQTRKKTVYALVRVNGDLTPSGYKNGSGAARAGRVHASASTVEAFADLLTKAEGRPVLDFTEVEGLYDFDLTSTPETAATPFIGRRVPGKAGNAIGTAPNADGSMGGGPGGAPTEN